jgi:hypothetical protein
MYVEHALAICHEAHLSGSLVCLTNPLHYFKQLLNQIKFQTHLTSLMIEAKAHIFKLHSPLPFVLDETTMGMVQV